MPLFGAIDEIKRLADKCYKFMNTGHLAKQQTIQDGFCTEYCTEFRRRRYRQYSAEQQCS